MRRIFDHEHSVSISAESIIFGVLFVLGLYFLYYIREIVIIVFLAVILMSALHPGMRFLVKRLRLPKIVAILMLYMFVIFCIAFLLAVVIPPLATEVPTLVHSLNLPPLPTHLQDLQVSLPQLSSVFTSSVNVAFSIVLSTLNGVIAFLTILVMSLYMLIGHDTLHKKILWFSHEERHVELVKEFMADVEQHLGGWVRAQLFLMVTIGVMAYIGLTLLAIPFALPLAIATSLLEVLPNIGPTLAAIPALVVAYTAVGPLSAAFVLLFYVLVQQLENHILVPNFMKRNVDVSPLVTIISILIGIKVGGVLGAFLAVPTYIVLRSAYSLWSREREKANSAE